MKNKHLLNVIPSMDIIVEWRPNTRIPKSVADKMKHLVSEIKQGEFEKRVVLHFTNRCNTPQELKDELDRISQGLTPTVIKSQINLQHKKSEQIKITTSIENIAYKPKNKVAGTEKYRFPRGGRNFTKYKRDKEKRQKIQDAPGPFMIDNMKVTRQQILEKMEVADFEIIDEME